MMHHVTHLWVVLPEAVVECSGVGGEGQVGQHELASSGVHLEELSSGVGHSTQQRCRRGRGQNKAQKSNVLLQMCLHEARLTGLGSGVGHGTQQRCRQRQM